jgi:hypothetical protein
MGEPFAAFPSWFMRIECDRCGRERVVSKAHTPQGVRSIRDILARMRHDGPRHPLSALWRTCQSAHPRSSRRD